MSKLDDLIRERCPKGVAYKTLENVGTFFGGLSGKSKEDFTDGNAKFITYKNVYSNPALQIDVDDRVKIAESEKQHTLQYGDVIFTGSSETPDECGISSVVTVKTNEKLYLNSFCFFFRFNEPDLMLPDFAKHLFRSRDLRFQIGKTASGVTRFNVSKKLMGKIRIPVPPLAVQREIVRILDNFTELTAELTARKQQYEYYRDDLLTFKQQEVKWLAIEDLFNIKGGYTPSKDNNEFWNNGTIDWFRLEDINQNGRVLYEANQKVTELAVKKSGLFKENSLIITTSATIGEYALIKVPFLCNQRFTCLTIKDEHSQSLMPEFMLHYAYKLSAFCKEHLHIGNFASVDMTQFNKFKFPIPTLDVQERIVNVLDNFDTICSDLKIGLPAEIEARQKQYEYYRDKLLTFKQKQ